MKVTRADFGKAVNLMLLNAHIWIKPRAYVWFKASDTFPPLAARSVKPHLAQVRLKIPIYAR